MSQFSVLQALLFLGKQGLALRGHRDSLSTLDDLSNNSGNFLELLKLIGKYNPVLEKHLSNPSKKNATYVSKTIQNEIINLIADGFIKKDIIKNILEAKFFTISVDESTTGTEQYMSLVARYVNSSKEIREDFLGFVRVDRITGEYLAGEIRSFLKNNNLDVSMLRGQRKKHKFIFICQKLKQN